MYAGTEHCSPEQKVAYWAGELSILLKDEYSLEELEFIKEQLDLAYSTIKRHRSH